MTIWRQQIYWYVKCDVKSLWMKRKVDISQMWTDTFISFKSWYDGRSLLLWIVHCQTLIPLYLLVIVAIVLFAFESKIRYLYDEYSYEQVILLKIILSTVIQGGPERSGQSNLAVFTVEGGLDSKFPCVK